MLSLGKLLFLALVIAVVWFGWRWYARVGAIGRERLEERRRRSATARRPTAPEGRPALDAEDMEKCPECGAWVVPRSAQSCGRGACPYGR